ncbi:MAG: alpha-glucosidase C-terminal domain-containing protein, partial [Candidatus Sulfotelmatobacter sp.]
VQDRLRLRREHPALREGELIHIFADDQVFAFVRQHAEASDGPAEQLLVVMNNADQPRTIELNIRDTPIAKARSIRALMGTGNAELLDGPGIKVPVASRSVNIYQVD